MLLYGECYASCKHLVHLQVLQSCGGPDLPRSVMSPHLCKDAVDFLRGHLTPKEMTIFELLGEGWTRPRYICGVVMDTNTLVMIQCL